MTSTAPVFHVPPPAEELPQRLEALCLFANGETPQVFIHPVLRAIALHFWLAYDHPLRDDNDLTYVLVAQVKVIMQAIGSLHA